MKSPCIKICQLDEKEYCLGCGRSKKEISNWTSYTNFEREEILKRLSAD